MLSSTARNSASALISFGGATPRPNPEVVARRLKRGAKNLVVQALDKMGVSERKISRRRSDLILMYHAVERERSGYVYSVSPACLEEHLQFLRRHFTIVPLDDMFEQSADRSRVALTFDDAYEDFYFNAYPLLRRYQVPATVFIPTRYIGKEPDELHNKLFGCAKRHVTWEHIYEMQASGLIRFDSHTHTHYNATERTDILREDLLTSIEVLRRKIGYSPKYFAYPYGARNAGTDAIVLSCGFKRLLTTEPRMVNGEVREGRFNVCRNNEALSRFKMTIAEIDIKDPRFWLASFV